MLLYSFQLYNRERGVYHIHIYTYMQQDGIEKRGITYIYILKKTRHNGVLRHIYRDNLVPYSIQ